MDVQKELGKWKSEYVKCNTPEELADHKKRFRAFLQTLSPEDKKSVYAGVPRWCQAINQ